MLPSFYSIARLFISINLMGLSIKLLDDTIDKENTNYVPYTMCALCISLYVDPTNISLFFGSYIIGMFHDQNLRLISGLKAYHEQIIVLLLSFIFSGFRETLFSLFIISSIQLIDDLIDEKQDKLDGNKNWAVSVGRIEAASFLLIFILISFVINPLKSLLCIISALLVSWIFNSIEQIQSKAVTGW